MKSTEGRHPWWRHAREDARRPLDSATYWHRRFEQVAAERDGLFDELECLRYHHAVCKIARRVGDAPPDQRARTEESE